MRAINRKVVAEVEYEIAVKDPAGGSIDAGKSVAPLPRRRRCSVRRRWLASAPCYAFDAFATRLFGSDPLRLRVPAIDAASGAITVHEAEPKAKPTGS